MTTADPGCVKTRWWYDFPAVARDRIGSFIAGADRSQGTLFPECLYDRVDEHNPVRVADALVDGEVVSESEVLMMGQFPESW